MAAIAGTLAGARPTRAQATRTLRFVPQADAAILDPMITTGLVNRNHGFLIWDTLYGVDDAFVVQPQMVAGHVVENDGKTWSMTLREGLASTTKSRCGARRRRQPEALGLARRLRQFAVRRRR